MTFLLPYLSAPAPVQPAPGYLDTPTIVLLVLGLVAALVCLISGLNGHAPGRITVGMTLLTQVAVVVYAAIYLLRHLDGQSPLGPTWELWAYLITVVFLPALALVWAREEPTRWSTFVLAVSGFVVAVMCARSAQIWHGIGMMPT